MANPLLALRSALFETGASEDVTFTPAGPSSAGVTLRAVRGGDVAGTISNLGGTPLRGVTFEIQKADIAEQPRPASMIVTAEGERWRVTQATDQDIVGSWLCQVQRAPQ